MPDWIVIALRGLQRTVVTGLAGELRSGGLFVLHRYLGWAVAAIVVLHIATALQHYVIRRDGVLQRMLPGAGV